MVTRFVLPSHKMPQKPFTATIMFYKWWHWLESVTSVVCVHTCLEWHCGIQTGSFSLPSNFLCLETNVVLILWLFFSTKLSNSSLLCWLSLSSISDVQQVYPWGQTRRCSPKGDRHTEPHFYTHQCQRIGCFKRLSWVFDQKLCDFVTLITEAIKEGQAITNGKG